MALGAHADAEQLLRRALADAEQLGGIVDGLLHGDVGKGRRVAHEAELLAVDVLTHVDGRHSGHVGAHPHVDLFLVKPDARAALAK